MNSLTRLVRFHVLGNQDDLNAALHLSRQALANAGAFSNYLGIGVIRLNLGITLGTRYDVSGDRHDLDECIALHRTLIAESSETAAYLPFAHNNVVIALGIRFDITGEEADLDEAWDLVQQELQKLPAEHRLYVDHLQNLGLILQRRYKIHSRPDDLTEAISAFMRALEAKKTHRDRAERLINLAKALIVRAKDFGRTTDDLDRAITLLCEALELRPLGHPKRHEILNALADAHAHRFELSRASGDLDEAFRIQSESVEGLSLGHAHQPQALFGLARLHLFQGTEIFDVTKALDISIKATRDSNSTAQLSLVSALDLLSSFETVAQSPYFRADQRLQLLVFYQEVIALTPRVAFFGLDLESRLRVLAKADNIATAAAMHAIILGQLEVAIEVLEQGRGVFWAQALRLRTQLSDLPHELAENLNAAARELDVGSRKLTGESAKETKAVIEEEARKLRQLSDKFEDLLTEARRIPGQGRFLLPEQYSTLSAATTGGPVIVFLSGHDRCAAIILRDSVSPQLVDMPDIAPGELSKYGTELLSAHHDYRNEFVDAESADNDIEADRLGIITRRRVSVGDEVTTTLDELWSKVMWPVIQALGLPVSFLPLLTK
jgi:tetratricopeptide (TPR) repeat protein